MGGVHKALATLSFFALTACTEPNPTYHSDSGAGLWDARTVADGAQPDRSSVDSGPMDGASKDSTTPRDDGIVPADTRVIKYAFPCPSPPPCPPDSVAVGTIRAVQSYSILNVAPRTPNAKTTNANRSACRSAKAKRAGR